MYKKGKAIPLTGCGGPQGSEMLRLPCLLDNRLVIGGEITDIYPQEFSWYSFLLEAELTPGP
jgi:hypothetical protein